MGAFENGKYCNFFKETGIDEAAVQARLKEIYQTLFYGSEDERIYREVGDDMAVMVDTGNNDARTEGMSYGMMMCVQMDRKAEFDRLWKWTKTYMYLEDGDEKGFFAWSCQLDGTKNAYGAAPDGEEYFAMALLFAAHRWGSGEGIFNYEAQARELLHTCISKEETAGVYAGRAMWDRHNHLIRFITSVDFTDPSYHLPHFYELFSKWALPEDRQFFVDAADCSRAYLHSACHPETGLCAEYSHFDGRPYSGGQEIWGRHDWYYSDAYRTIMNIAIDHSWFGVDPWQVEEGKRFLRFFEETLTAEEQDGVFTVDGRMIECANARNDVDAGDDANARDGIDAGDDANARDDVGAGEGVNARDDVDAGEIAERRDDSDSHQGRAAKRMKALHPVAMIATKAAAAALSADFARDQVAQKVVREFWNTPLRTGERRYYDNCLYFFCFLLLSGNYRMYYDMAG